MLEKREKAFSSYHNANIYKKLTYDQLKIAFPNKIKRIASPKQNAIIERNKLYQMIKNETKHLREIHTYNIKQKKNNQQNIYQTPFNRSKRLKNIVEDIVTTDPKDSILESIKKCRKNIINRENYARSLKKDLLTNNIGKQIPLNSIKNTVFIEEPNPQLIQQLIIQQNVRQNMESNPQKSQPREPQKKITTKYNTNSTKSLKSVRRIKIHNSQEDINKFYNMENNNMKVKKPFYQPNIRERIQDAMQFMKIQENKIEMHIKKEFENWENFSTPEENKKNKDRANILYQNRWNRALSKILYRFDIEDFRDKFLEQYYMQPQEVLIQKEIQEQTIQQKISNMKKKVERSKRTLQKIPIMDLGSKYKQLLRT